MGYEVKCGLNYYDMHAEEYFIQTFHEDMTDTYRHFLPRLPAGCRILDLGSGSGRDAVYFRKQGYEVTALEPSKRLCEWMKRQFDGEIVCLPVEEYHPVMKFDAIWACASLLHLIKEDLLEFFAGIGGYLKPGGLIYVSGKNGIQTGKCQDGRFFLEFDEILFREIIETDPGFRVEQVWYSGDAAGRTGFQWMNFVLKYRV